MAPGQEATGIFVLDTSGLNHLEFIIGQVRGQLGIFVLDMSGSNH